MCVKDLFKFCAVAVHVPDSFRVGANSYLACSAGVFFGRANVFPRERAMLKPKRGGNGASHCQKMKDGGYNNTNTNKVLPTQKRPALQANSYLEKCRHDLR